VTFLDTTVISKRDGAEPVDRERSRVLVLVRPIEKGPKVRPKNLRPVRSAAAVMPATRRWPTPQDYSQTLPLKTGRRGRSANPVMVAMLVASMMMAAGLAGAITQKVTRSWFNHHGQPRPTSALNVSEYKSKWNLSPSPRSKDALAKRPMATKTEAKLKHRLQKKH
jgi:hypothetical protein